MLMGADSEGEELLQTNMDREPAMFEVGIPSQYVNMVGLPPRRSDNFCIESGHLGVDETDFYRFAKICDKIPDF